MDQLMDQLIEQCLFPNACREVVELRAKNWQLNKDIEAINRNIYSSLSSAPILTYGEFASKIEKRQHPGLFFTELVWRGYDATGESIGLSQQVHCSPAIDTSMVEEATKEEMYRKYLERVAWDR